MTPISILPFLTDGMSPLHVRLRENLIAPLTAEFPVWAATSAEAVQDSPWEQVIYFLLNALSAKQARFSSLRRFRDDFNSRYNRSLDDNERREHILAFCRELGSDERSLEEDRKALERWFGHDGLMDRFQKRLSDTERQICFILDRLGVVIADRIVEAGDGATQFWQRISLENALMPLLAHDGDNRVCIAAFNCLATAIGSLPAADRTESVSSDTQQFVYRCALEPRQQVWLQACAMDLLARLSPASLATALRNRLFEPAPNNDDIFLRRRAVTILGEALPCMPELADLLPLVLNDPSDYVRQALPRAVRHDAGLMDTIAVNDPSPQVRSAALLALFPSGTVELPAEWHHELLLRVMKCEQDLFVLRVCLKVIGDGAEVMAEQGNQPALNHWCEQLLPGIHDLHCHSPHLPLRRWAAQATELLWCLADPARRSLRQGLASQMARMGQGKKRRLPLELTTRHDENTLGRVVALLSQNGFGCELSRRGSRYSLVKGHRFRFSWWRFIHEMLNPTPDKRQAFRHTISRHFKTGQIRTPSAIMAEVSPTRVPGEPLFMAEEGGWRPYLPLPDEFLSELRGILPRKAARIITSEGITEIEAPRPPWRRLWARAALTLRFPRYAQLRNWHESGLTSPTEYLEVMKRLGFSVRFFPHDSGNRPIDPSVSRFFPLAIPFLVDGQFSRAANYFISVYENSLEDLGIFAACLLSLFLAERFLLNRKSKRARRGIPLVIGGWGTRGKSGTERLKAALFTANGFGVVSKTTGCEAMILHAFPFDTLREMFIFRPYDKATIWEQHSIMALAGELGSEVLLWECMGLTPAYVDILQRCWMRDDIATITNAFPDHEDIQGPAGINIPEVMTEFIPRNSTLLTSEEQMLPILAEAAARAGTAMTSVGWLEAGMLTRDVLQRFPYEEHPYNVALVLALADTLGFDRDFALKEMAERVVPDIGVLKAYPVARLRTRGLQFINGMSANDRYGCLENWRRMGLERCHPDDTPGTWVTTVVNNRADRVARSKVFAQILVEDISADRHILIGTNLHGLMGYIDRSLEEHLAGLSLWPDSGGSDPHPPLAILADAARRQRVPTTEAQLEARLRAMLGNNAAAGRLVSMALSGSEAALFREQLVEAGCLHTDQVMQHFEFDRKRHDEYARLAARLQAEGAGNRPGIESEYRNLVKKWFKERIVVVEDYHTTGEQLINRICSETPPHYSNRIMGLQNIKGTGLDFVYRWQAWNQCHAACEDLLSDNPAHVSKALTELSSFQGFGFLCEEHVRATVAAVRPLHLAQSEQHQAELSIIISNLETSMREITAALHVTRERNLAGRIIDICEAFLDAGDSIRRRKTADSIYRDLINERISRQRAAMELQSLIRRQKGGWLLEKLRYLKRLLYRK